MQERRHSGAWTEDQLTALPKMLRRHMAVPTIHEDHCEAVIEEVLDVIDLYNSGDDSTKIQRSTSFLLRVDRQLSRKPSKASVMSSELSFSHNEHDNIIFKALCATEPTTPLTQVVRARPVALTEVGSAEVKQNGGCCFEIGSDATDHSESTNRRPTSLLFSCRSKIHSWRRSVGKHAPKFTDNHKHLPNIPEEEHPLVSEEDEMPRCISRWSNSTPTCGFDGLRRSIGLKASGVIKDSTEMIRDSIVKTMFRRPRLRKDSQ